MKIIFSSFMIVSLLFVAFVNINTTKVFRNAVNKRAINYCNKKLCPSDKHHIACGHNGRFVKTCPHNARMIPLNRYRTLLVNEHNHYRNIVAGGGIKKLKTARRMATMRWSQHLANMASYNVKQCKMVHDQCRNTPYFLKSGQNLVLNLWPGKPNTINYRQILRESIRSLFIEYKYVTMSVINSYVHGNGTWSHFTAMVADKNVAVGCAASQYVRNVTTYLLMACNYARTNILQRPVYIAGPTAIGCKTGRHRKYTKLCSIKEQFDVNNFN